jgi:hypothetical protein
VQAHNAIGYSILSNPTVNASAAVMEYPPHQVVTPLRGSSTTTSQLEITWSALTGDQTGGASVTSYHLEWDHGTA